MVNRLVIALCSKFSHALSDSWCSHSLATTLWCVHMSHIMSVCGRMCGVCFATSSRYVYICATHYWCMVVTKKAISVVLCGSLVFLFHLQLNMTVL